MVHRDLKSRNVFLTSDIPLSEIPDEMAAHCPLAKVGDFGLSQIVLFELVVTKGKGVMGNVNPRWMAPEILRGQSYSVRSDVYSLSLLFWEIKHRVIAFGESSGTFYMEKLVNSILKGDRPPIDMNDDFDNLCARMWRDNPALRPSANEIVEDLISQIKNVAPHLLEGDLSILRKTKLRPRSERMRVTSYIPRNLKCLEVSQASFGEERCRISCSTLRHATIWFGTVNGRVGVYHMESGEYYFADDYSLKEKSVVRCVASIDRTGCVWSGHNSGHLISWILQSGSAAAEAISWKGDVTLRRGKKSSGKSFQLSLACGYLVWQIGSGPSSPLCHVSVRNILDVTLSDEKKNEICIVTEGGSNYRFACEKSEELLHCLSRCRRLYTQEYAVTKRAERHVARNENQEFVVPVVSLIDLDGYAWTLDGRLFITEWIEEVCHSGMSQDVMNVVPRRTLHIDVGLLKRDKCPLQPVCLFAVTEGNVWVCVGNQFVCVSRDVGVGVSESGALKQRKEGIINRFASETVRPSDLMVLCVCVVNECGSVCGKERETEVWAATACGFIYVWRVSEGECVRKLNVGKVLSAMELFEEEVGGGDICSL